MNYQPIEIENAVNISKIYTIHYFEYNHDYSFGGEVHDFWELLYVDKGEISATLSKNTETLLEGNAVLYKPNEFHQLHANGITAPNTVVLSFHSDCKDLYSLSGQKIELDITQKSLIGEIISEASYAFSTNLGDPHYTKLMPSDNPQYGGVQLIKINLEKLMIMLLRKKAGKHIQSPSINKNNYELTIISQLKQFIDTHLSDELSPTYIAAKFNMSESFINKLSKKHLGKGIVSYIRERRIHAACKMMREGEDNFTEIASKLGFSSIHYFSRTFKVIRNMTPTQYSKSVKAMTEKDKN